MTDRRRLSDTDWSRIQILLSTTKGIRLTSTPLDCRRFVEAVLWILRSGAQWRMLPSRFGAWNSFQALFSLGPTSLGIDPERRPSARLYRQLHCGRGGQQHCRPGSAGALDVRGIWTPPRPHAELAVADREADRQAWIRRQTAGRQSSPRLSALPHRIRKNRPHSPSPHSCCTPARLSSCLQRSDRCSTRRCLPALA
ncbi:transposase [Azotobacter chroococcum subsp. isscasi]|uniref:transposase n=1 Tax=Azotobacter chroococcum TaxID=353 RepID=UPI001039B8E2|nr:transposase [Azotobacter chroococcum subsp. isscasi]